MKFRITLQESVYQETNPIN